MAKDVVLVGAWQTSSANSNAGRVVVVNFKFEDREMTYAIPVDQARLLAQGILTAVENVPPMQSN